MYADQLKTDIKLTARQRDWLEKTVTKYRKLELKYRNQDPRAFRKAITSGKGNFFLALGENGAIYGALSYVRIMDQEGLATFPGREETLIFSATNEKVFRYVGTSGKPVATNFHSGGGLLGFGDLGEDFGLRFTVLEDGRSALPAAADKSFKIGRDQSGASLITGTRTGAAIRILEVFEIY